MIAAMKEFHLSPFEWRALSRFDRLLLMYQGVMERYYKVRAMKKQQEEAEAEQRRRNFLSTLPRVRRP